MAKAFHRYTASEWESFPLADQLEVMRGELCTGPCGSSQSALDTRSKYRSTLIAARDEIARLTSDRDSLLALLREARNSLSFCVICGSENESECVPGCRFAAALKKGDAT